MEPTKVAPERVGVTGAWFGNGHWKLFLITLPRKWWVKPAFLRGLLWNLDLFIGPVPLGKCILAILILLDILL